MGNALKIKMGVDSSGVKKGTKEAQGHLNDFQKTVKTVSLAAAAAWAAIGTAVTKVVKDMIGLTQKWGDAFEVRMGGMRNVYRTFVRDLASGEGWNSFISHIKEAYKEGKKTAEMFDALFELDNASKLRVAYLENEISALKIIERDTTKSDQERLDASNKIIENEKKIGEIKREYAQAAYNANMKNFRDATRMTEEEARAFILEHANNQQLLEDAAKYVELKKAAQEATGLWLSGGSGVTKGKRLKAKEEADAALSSFMSGKSEKELISIQRLANLYNRANDETVTGLINSWLALLNIERDVNDATNRSVRNANKMAESIKDTNKEITDGEIISNPIDLSLTLGKVNFYKGAGYERIYEEIASKMQDFADGVDPIPIDIQVKPLVEITGDQLKNLLGGLASDVAASVGEMVADLISGEDAMQNWGQNILKIVGQFATKFGELLISIGVAKLSLDSVFANPYAAIAAGAVLVALGAAVTKLANNMYGTSYSSNSTVASGYNNTNYANDYATSSMTVNVTGTLVASGSELIAVINNENNRKNHTT